LVRDQDNPPAERTEIFVIVLIIIVIGLVVTIAVTIAYEYYPRNKTVTFHNGTDIDFIMVRENNFLIPVRAFFSHLDTNVTIKFYYKNSTYYNYAIQSITLSSNSSSVFTVHDEHLEPSGDEPGVVTARVEVGHPLLVNTYAEPYTIDVFYKKVPRDTVSTPTIGEFSTNATISEFTANATITEFNGNTRTDESLTNTTKIAIRNAPLLHEAEHFVWTVRALDLGTPTYFWIVFAGVALSRVFSFTRSAKGITRARLRPVELVWIPVSAIITLLIFSSFSEQVNLTTDIVPNIALAFGFGFGFDKIFETWSLRKES
jgi:hypothetical protein